MPEEKKDSKKESKIKSKPESTSEEKTTEQSKSKNTSEATAEKKEEVAPEAPKQEEKLKVDEQPASEMETTTVPADLQSQPASATADIPLELETETSSFLSKKLIAPILALVLIGGLAGGGVYLFFRTRGAAPEADKEPAAKSESQPQSEKTQDSEISPAVSVTEAPKHETSEVNLTDYSLQVLNGSGVAGEAGAVKNLLANEDFSKIDVGNADSYDYTDTEVKLKKDTPGEVFEKIQAALADYTVVEGEALTEDAEYDVVIVVGEKKE